MIDQNFDAADVRKGVVRDEQDLHAPRGNPDARYPTAVPLASVGLVKRDKRTEKWALRQ